jgi:hypothetical protein
VPGAGVLGARVAQADDQDAVALLSLAATAAAAKDRQRD